MWVLEELSLMNVMWVLEKLFLLALAYILWFSTMEVDHPHWEA